MIKQLYQDNKYINMKEIIEDKSPFKIVVGARGIGKTYSALLDALDKRIMFIYMRTTEIELAMCATEASNPFKAINRDFGTEYHVKKINKFIYGIYAGNETNYIGLCMALTTFSKCRGMDLSDVKLIIYDEFIAEKIQKRINGIGESLLNAYETVSRNRELMGCDPLKLLCMANALNVNNEILITFGVPSILQKMRNKGIEVYDDTNRGVLVICPLFSPIAEMKAQGAVYKINKKFNEMALGNQFREFYTDNITTKNIKHFDILFGFDHMYFYRDKSTREIYVSPFRAPGKKITHYNDTDYERESFKRDHYNLVDRYYNNRIRFENAELELEFINLFGLK